MNPDTTPRRKRPMFLYILIALAVVVVGLIVVVAMQPSEFQVVRTTTMAAPPDAIFAQVNDFHKWEAWNPWAKIDPAMKQEYSGEDAGVGAKYAWEGNNQVGSGRMTIIESKPSESIAVQLDFEKPMKGTSVATFTFEPDDGNTRVTWQMAGDNNFMGKAIGLVMNMDTMIGGNFEQGLADMKAVAEAEAQDAPASTTRSAEPAVDSVAQPNL